MLGRCGTEQGQQSKGGAAMKGCPFVDAKGAPRTFTYYALKRNREPVEFMGECARHAVAMKTVERIPAGSSPNTSAASIRTWVGWALGWAPLDMHASGIWTAVQGAHLKPLFGKPPRLPENHRWVFARIDAGVPSNLSASSPTFLMAPGQDVLH